MRKFYALFFIIISVIILLDFIIPGKTFNQEIIRVRSETQQYHNPARNSHVVYKVITPLHEFFAADDFIQKRKDSDKIQYSVSRIFKEINWYKLNPLESKTYYSLRLYSGLIIPMLAIITMVLNHYYNWRIEVFSFIVKGLLLGDLLFLFVY